jgi:hypothetical protein
MLLILKEFWLRNENRQNLLLNLKMVKPALVYNSSQKTILLQPGRKRQYRIVLYGPLCRSTTIDKGAGAGAEVTASEFCRCDSNRKRVKKISLKFFV